MADVSRIEERIDRTELSTTSIDMKLGGVQFSTMIEVMEFAKLMAVSGLAVPLHMRGNPGACLAVCTKALRFGFDPFALAEHSYTMEKNVKDEANQWHKIETIAYDSFVIHAIIEAHAPLMGRLRITYEGEGDNRTCTVTGIPRGEKEPLTHTGPTLGQLKAARGRNEKGQIKGSPLWDTKPDQQLAYDTRRDFCRKFFPEVLMGWIDRDEMDENVRAETAQDVTTGPKLSERLPGKGKNRRGFHADNTKEIEHKPAETLPEAATATGAAEAVTVAATSAEPATAETGMGSGADLP